jgi:hypothetical protein
MKPSQFGLPYREVTITTKDNVSLQCYLLQQKDVEVAKKSPTVIYFHANAGNMVRFLMEKDDLKIQILKYFSLQGSQTSHCKDIFRKLWLQCANAII